MSRWRWELTTITGTRIGELQDVRDRVVTIPVSRLPSANFRVRLDHPLADSLLADDRMVKAYRDGVLRYTGLVVGVEEVAEAEAQSISVTTVSPAWRLQGRLLGKSLAPPHPGVAFGSAEVPVDIGTICEQIITIVNADGGSLTTGVQVGTVQTSSSTMLGPVWFKPALEAITELLHSAAAPEIEWKPIEPTGSGANVALVEFNAYYPRMGSDKPNAVFEFGTGKRNVSSYQRQISYEGLANRAHVLPESFPTTGGWVARSENTASITARRPYEVVVETDVVYDALRGLLADAHVAIRGTPRNVILFRPIRNADVQPYTDFGLGDTVTARARINGVVRFNAGFRVYGMTFNIDDNGNEDVELELILPA